MADPSREQVGLRAAYHERWETVQKVSSGKRP